MDPQKLFYDPAPQHQPETSSSSLVQQHQGQNPDYFSPGALNNNPNDPVLSPITSPSPIAQQSQHQFGQDTAYHGWSPNDNRKFGYDIPLQDQNPQHNPVYHQDGASRVPDEEYGHTSPPPPHKKALNKVGFGQLGMLASKKKFPLFVYLFSIVQVAVFIAEIARNATLTGSPIMTKPYFNPMIGPTPWVMINMGARWNPCMSSLPEEKDPRPQSIKWPCPSSTSMTGDCTLGQLCGMGGFKTTEDPNQWWRFITPIFMHAGLVHIGFNLLLQMMLAREIERTIGSIRFFLVYMSAGIFGFVMSGNYAGNGAVSTGASGSLFGIIGLTLLDLLYSWKDRASPVKDLVLITLDIVISLALGLLPGLDNFAHIGGLVMGIGLGVCVLHSPNALRRRLGPESSYVAVDSPYATTNEGVSFFKNPRGFFKGRKPLWWAWWLLRAGFLLTVVIGFIFLLDNFYNKREMCNWCRYLSCLPVRDWCEAGALFNRDPK